MINKSFYTTVELAKLLGISRVAVFNRIKSGEIKAEKMGRNFVIFKKDIDINELASSLFKNAKNWVILQTRVSGDFYCQNSAVFGARLVRMETDMLKSKKTKNIFSLLTSIAGEIGNNSYDHNLGHWPDVPGIFFGYDLNKRQIVLADRGLGILATLQKAKPELKNHEEALKTAFTEIISGRAPESRGNGLKYVRKVVVENPINLFFQTGNAKLNLLGRNKDIKIEQSEENIQGCLAFITY